MEIGPEDVLDVQFPLVRDEPSAPESTADNDYSTDETCPVAIIDVNGDGTEVRQV